MDPRLPNDGSSRPGVGSTDARSSTSRIGREARKGGFIRLPATQATHVGDTLGFSAAAGCPLDPMGVLRVPPWCGVMSESLRTSIGAPATSNGSRSILTRRGDVVFLVEVALDAGNGEPALKDVVEIALQVDVIDPVVPGGASRCAP